MGAMSTSTQQNGSRPEFRTGPLITSAALIGAGTLIAVAGLAVGGSHLLAATRRWIREMEVPPREQARIKWTQAKTAAAAGAAAWQNGVSSHETAGT
jgi:hypothetical protein